MVSFELSMITATVSAIAPIRIAMHARALIWGDRTIAKSIPANVGIPILRPLDTAPSAALPGAVELR
jgi:hypothetical protein